MSAGRPCRDWQPWAIRVKLLAFSLPNQRFTPGETVALTLDWQIRTVTATHNLSLHLVDPNNQLVLQANLPLTNSVCGDSSQFSPGIVVTCDTLVLPAGLAAGEYQLQAGVYNSVTGQRFTDTDGDSAIAADRY